MNTGTLPTSEKLIANGEIQVPKNMIFKEALDAFVKIPKDNPFKLSALLQLEANFPKEFESIQTIIENIEARVVPLLLTSSAEEMMVLSGNDGWQNTGRYIEISKRDIGLQKSGIKLR